MSTPLSYIVKSKKVILLKWIKWIVCVILSLMAFYLISSELQIRPSTFFNKVVVTEPELECDNSHNFSCEAKNEVVDCDKVIRFKTSARLVNEIANYIIPTVVMETNNVTIPQQEIDDGVIDEMHLTNFGIDGVNITLAPQGAPNMTIKMRGVKVTIPPTNFTVTKMLVTCTGQLWAEMNETNISFSLALDALQNGTLNASVDSTAIEWGNVFFNHSLDSKFCHITESVIELFIGKVNDLAVEEMKTKLQTTLPTTVAQNLNDAFGQLPVFFVQDPTFTPDRVVSYLSLIPTFNVWHKNTLRKNSSSSSSESSSSSSSSESSSSSSSSFWSVRSEMESTSSNIILCTSNPPQARESLSLMFPERDFTISIPSRIVNEWLSYNVEKGKLNTREFFPSEFNTSILEHTFPEIYALCSECALSMSVNFTLAPVVEYDVNNTLRLSVQNVQIGLYMSNFSSLDTFTLRYSTHYEQVHLPSSNTYKSSIMRALAVNVVQWLALQSNPHQIKVLQKGQLNLTNDTFEPILVTELNGSLEIGMINFTGANMNSLLFTIAPLKQLNIHVLITKIGPISDDLITQNVLDAANEFVIPFINLESNFTLSNAISNGVITIDVNSSKACCGSTGNGDSVACVGFDVNLFNQLPENSHESLLKFILEHQ